MVDFKLPTGLHWLKNFLNFQRWVSRSWFQHNPGHYQLPWYCSVIVGQGQINFHLTGKPKVSKPHPVPQLPTPTSGSPSPPSLHRVQKGENQAVTCPLCPRPFFASLPRRTKELSRARLWATLIISKNPPLHSEVRLISPQKGQASPVFLFLPRDVISSNVFIIF